jgi:hypothetical protein
MLEWIQAWWPVVGGIWSLTLFLGLVTWVKWSFRQQFATRVDLANEVEARRELEARVERHAQVIDGLPTREQFHQLDRQLVALSGKLDTTNARLDRVDRIADRLEAWHLQGNRS